MFLPTSANLPWKPDEATIWYRGRQKINADQVEYLRQLVKALMSMYADIANTVNSMAYRNNGMATVVSGDTTVAILHGVAKTPGLKDISVTPTNNLGNATKFWISAPTTTQFTINVNLNPGASGASFAWEVHILG